MKVIKQYVDIIDEELCGAKDYAEMYVERKAYGDSSWANRFKEMANDELRHAMYIHDYAVSKIQEIGKTFTPPAEMQEEWDRSHKEYVEKTAWIKQMLSM